MRMLRKSCVVFALVCALVLAEDVSESSKAFPPPPPAVKPTPETSTSTSTSTTTTTTTTGAPNKTTSAPTTTTSATTTTSTTSTTTKIPSTTTPTTPAPTTLAPPTTSHYVVKNGNDTCIMADLAIQIQLNIDNKTSEFDVPSNISSNGACNNNSQELELAWEDESGKNYTLWFVFTKNVNTSKFMASEIILTIPQDNSTVNLTSHKDEFTTSVSKSYRCEKQQEIKLAEDLTNSTYAILKISHVQLQAFHAAGDGKYGAAEDCAGSSSPDIVPIAVGCALVGLIAIVLIAYLVGRRRSQARGYLSM